MVLPASHPLALPNTYAFAHGAKCGHVRARSHGRLLLSSFISNIESKPN